MKRIYGPDRKYTVLSRIYTAINEILTMMRDSSTSSMIDTVIKSQKHQKISLVKYAILGEVTCIPFER